MGGVLYGDEPECMEDLVIKVNTYDQAVDIVSCWESFLTYSYSEHFPDFYFDRFPSMRDNGNSLTPDFTVLFDEKYGIVFEVKRTIGDSDNAIKKLVEQLKSYDQSLPFKSKSSEITPTNHDIVLIIEHGASREIANRIDRFISENEGYSFTKSLIIIEYHFNSRDAHCRYEFDKVLISEKEFNDSSLPLEKRLENKMGSSGDYQTLKIFPKHFLNYKVRKVIMNDEPPPIYLICFLWHKVLYHYLSEDQREIWKKRNPNTILEISLKTEELAKRINSDFVPESGIKESWIRKALDFLVILNIASRNGSLYTIKFCNIIVRKRDEIVEETAQFHEFDDLARRLISKFCKEYIEGNIKLYAEPREDEPTTEQISIDKFKEK